MTYTWANRRGTLWKPGNPLHVREEQLPSPGRDAPEKPRKGLVGVTAIGTRDRQAQSWAEPGKPGLGGRSSPP